jgi:hypothetical protein
MAAQVDMEREIREANALEWSPQTAERKANAMVLAAMRTQPVKRFTGAVTPEKMEEVHDAIENGYTVDFTGMEPGEPLNQLEAQAGVWVRDRARAKAAQIKNRFLRSTETFADAGLGPIPEQLLARAGVDTYGTVEQLALESPRSPAAYSIIQEKIRDPSNIYSINKARLSTAMDKYKPTERTMVRGKQVKPPMPYHDTGGVGGGITAQHAATAGLSTGVIKTVVSNPFTDEFKAANLLKFARREEAEAVAIKEGTRVIYNKNSKRFPYTVKTKKYMEEAKARYQARRGNVVTGPSNALAWYEARNLVIQGNVPGYARGYTTTIVNRRAPIFAEGQLPHVCQVLKPNPGKFNAMPQWFIEYKDAHPGLGITYYDVGYVRQGEKGPIATSIIFFHPETGGGFRYLIFVRRVENGKKKLKQRDPYYISESTAKQAVYKYSTSAARARSTLGAKLASRNAEKHLLSGDDMAGWLRLKKLQSPMPVFKPVYARTFGNVAMPIIFVTAGRIFVRRSSTTGPTGQATITHSLVYSRTKYPLVLNPGRFKTAVGDDTLAVLIKDRQADNTGHLAEYNVENMANINGRFRSSMGEVPGGRMRSPIKTINWSVTPMRSPVLALEVDPMENNSDRGYVRLYSDDVFGNHDFTPLHLKAYIHKLKILNTVIQKLFDMCKQRDSDKWPQYVVPKTADGYKNMVNVIAEVVKLAQLLSNPEYGFIDTKEMKEIQSHLSVLNQYIHTPAAAM